MRRLRQVPPQVNINLTNLNLPAINIANLPAVVDQNVVNMIVQQAVNASVQQSLNNAAVEAVRQLLESLPQIGFERIVFNSGWHREE